MFEFIIVPIMKKLSPKKEHFLFIFVESDMYRNTTPFETFNVCMKCLKATVLDCVADIPYLNYTKVSFQDQR